MKTTGRIVQKAFIMSALCVAFLSADSFLMGETTDGIYLIDGKSVAKEEFNKFLSTLKEVPGTWFCAETNKGGRTGWDARDDKGVVYEYRCYSESNNSKQTIRQKGKKDNLPPSSSE
jgi:hypothetical protein